MKKVIIVVILIVILALGGYFIFGKKLADKSQTSGSQTSTTAGTSSKTTGIKEGLTALLEGTTGVKCSVEDTTGKYTVTAKGGKAKIEGIEFPNPNDPKQANQKGTMINDGTWVYIWGGKEGIKFNIKDMNDLSKAQGTEEFSKDSDWQDWAKSMETSGAKYDCNPGVITDSDFTPSSDVKFQDWGEMLKGFQNLQQNAAGAVDLNKFAPQQ